MKEFLRKRKFGITVTFFTLIVIVQGCKISELEDRVGSLNYKLSSLESDVNSLERKVQYGY